MNEIKERHGCVSAWLWIAILCNFGCAVYYAAWMFNVGDSAAIGYGLLSILSAINVLGSVLLMRWNKRGFYLFLTSSLLTAVVNIGVLELGPYLLFPSISSIVIWWGILQIKKDGVSAWSLLDDDWDYKHCRHLYQLFGVIIGVLFALTIFAYTSRSGGSLHRDAESAELLDTIALIEDDKGVKQDIEWKTFSDENNTCSIEAPNDFRTAQLSDDQILGLICTDYDPGVIVISETVKSLKGAGINTTKDYANVIVKMNKNQEGATDFKKISEETYGEGSYLVVYNLTIDGTKFRYSLLTSKTKSNFYYCQVFCLQEYTEKLQPTISHMLSSFKAIK